MILQRSGWRRGRLGGGRSGRIAPGLLLGRAADGVHGRDEMHDWRQLLSNQRDEGRPEAMRPWRQRSHVLTRNPPDGDTACSSSPVVPVPCRATMNRAFRWRGRAPTGTGDLGNFVEFDARRTPQPDYGAASVTGVDGTV